MSSEEAISGPRRTEVSMPSSLESLEYTQDLVV